MLAGERALCASDAIVVGEEKELEAIDVGVNSESRNDAQRVLTSLPDTSRAKDRLIYIARSIVITSLWLFDCSFLQSLLMSVDYLYGLLGELL